MLVVGATGDAPELVLRRDGAAPLRAPFRAGEDEHEAELPLAALAEPGRWESSLPLAGRTRLGAVGVVAGAGGYLRVRPEDAGGRLAIVAEPLAPHAEARSVRVEDGVLGRRGRRPGDGPARRAPPARRRRGDGGGAGRGRPLHRAPAARAARPGRRVGPPARRAADRRARGRAAGQEGDRRLPRVRGRRAGAAAVLHGRGQPVGARRAAGPAPRAAARARRRVAPPPPARRARRRAAPGRARPRRGAPAAPRRAAARRPRRARAAAARLRARRHGPHELQPRRRARGPRRRPDLA